MVATVIYVPCNCAVWFLILGIEKDVMQLFFATLDYWCSVNVCWKLQSCYASEREKKTKTKWNLRKGNCCLEPEFSLPWWNCRIQEKFKNFFILFAFACGLLLIHEAVLLSQKRVCLVMASERMDQKPPGRAVHCKRGGIILCQFSPIHITLTQTFFLSNQRKTSEASAYAVVRGIWASWSRPLGLHDSDCTDFTCMVRVYTCNTQSAVFC